MGFLNDDPFEEILRNFFGDERVIAPKEKNFISGEAEDRNIDFIETENNIFILFELPGYTKEDITIDINGDNLVIFAKRKSSNKIEDNLINKLRAGIVINKILPKMIKFKKYNSSMINGILELTFKK